MKKFLLYAHGGCGNHGAEAIVKTTIRCIREKYPDAWIGISTHFPEQDMQFNIQADCLIAPNYQVWELEKKEKDANKKKALAAKMYERALSYIQQDVILLSVGGDNYCYGNWHRLAVFQEAATTCGAKSVLWGASVEPKYITSDMVKTLNSYSLIIARESITYQALLECGVKTRIELLPDIAFALKSQFVDIPQGSGYVGVNLSPLVMRRECSKGMILDNFSELVTMITTMGKKVLLIPHVTVAADNDREALMELYESLEKGVQENTFLMLDECGAMQYKYMISQCEMMICTRTHASIAAYSTNTPVLVVGYSVKSLGIAKDLEMDSYVIRVEDINMRDSLCKQFAKLYENSNDIRERLKHCMEDYIMQVQKYIEYI